MKTSPLLLGLVLTTLPVWAQTAAENGGLPVVGATATVTPFITGLKEPQGLALDDQSNVLVCDFGAGEVLKFTSEGAPAGQLATNLKGPSGIVSADGGKTMFVTEHGDRRVLRFQDGKRNNEMVDVTQPVGLAWQFDPARGDGPGQPRSLWVVSYSGSRVYRKKYFDGYNERSVVYATIAKEKSDPNATPNRQGGGRKGFRWMAVDGAKVYVTDEVGQSVLTLSEDGLAAPYVTGISKPSGIAVGPDKMIYVANEGDGGQLIRLGAGGEKTVVAQKLGRPAGLLFLDTKTVLVSNRDGGVWKVTLP